MNVPNIHAYLTTVADVTAVIASRVYPLQIPQHQPGESPKLPCVVYNRIGSARQQTTCGTDSLVEATYRIDCYSSRYWEAEALASAVREAMVDYSGTMGDVRVINCFLDQDFGFIETEPGLYGITQTYAIWYVE